MVLIDYFNAKSKNWYKNDKRNFQVNIIENVMTGRSTKSFKKPTNILDNPNWSIDIIFTSQANSLLESGVDPSWIQIVTIKLKFDLQIFYPPPCLGEVWHYKDVKTELIRRSVAMFAWEKGFSNTIVDKKVAIFNRTILNIVNNYIPHETIFCDKISKVAH